MKFSSALLCSFLAFTACASACGCWGKNEEQISAKEFKATTLLADARKKAEAASEAHTKATEAKTAAEEKAKTAILEADAAIQEATKAASSTPIVDELVKTEVDAKKAVAAVLAAASKAEAELSALTKEFEKAEKELKDATEEWKVAEIESTTAQASSKAPADDADKTETQTKFNAAEAKLPAAWEKINAAGAKFNAAQVKVKAAQDIVNTANETKEAEALKYPLVYAKAVLEAREKALNSYALAAAALIKATNEKDSADAAVTTAEKHLQKVMDDEAKEKAAKKAKKSGAKNGGEKDAPAAPKMKKTKLSKK